MVSPLSPIQTQAQPDNTLGNILAGRQSFEQSQLNNQAMQQNQMAMDRAPVVQGQQDRMAEQQISRGDYDQAVQRLSVMNRIAKKARELPEQEIPAFIQSLNPEMLKSVGIDPEQVKQFPPTYQALDALIAQTGAAMPQDMSQNRVQSSQILENGTTIQLLANGSTRVTDPSGTEMTGEARRKAIQEANQYGVDIQSQRAGGRTSAGLDARVEGGGQAQFVESVAGGRGKNIAAAEGRKDVAIEASQTQLPAIERAADKAITLVDELLAHPGRNMATGASAWVPPIPGTKQADFINRFDQIQGQAFLQAFESLKGGGPITDIEGKKATDALNRMNRATSKEGFDAAAADFKQSVDAIRQITKKKAEEGVQRQSAPAQQGSAPAQGATSRYKIEVLD
jgi:hypothetical protein